jgi:hypothetical protein
MVSGVNFEKYENPTQDFLAIRSPTIGKMLLYQRPVLPGWSFRHRPGVGTARTIVDLGGVSHKPTYQARASK